MRGVQHQQQQRGGSAAGVRRSTGSWLTRCRRGASSPGPPPCRSGGCASPAVQHRCPAQPTHGCSQCCGAGGTGGEEARFSGGATGREGWAGLVGWRAAGQQQQRETGQGVCSRAPPGQQDAEKVLLQLRQPARDPRRLVRRLAPVALVPAHYVCAGALQHPARREVGGGSARGAAQGGTCNIAGCQPPPARLTVIERSRSTCLWMGLSPSSSTCRGGGKRGRARVTAQPGLRVPAVFPPLRRGCHHPAPPAAGSQPQPARSPPAHLPCAAGWCGSGWPWPGSLAASWCRRRPTQTPARRQLRKELLQVDRLQVRSSHLPEAVARHPGAAEGGRERSGRGLSCWGASCQGRAGGAKAAAQTWGAGKGSLEGTKEGQSCPIQRCWPPAASRSEGEKSSAQGSSPAPGQ